MLAKIDFRFVDLLLSVEFSTGKAFTVVDA